MVAVSETTRRAAVIRVFERYLVEVVERYDLCPWARGTRQGGELAVDVVWGTPTLDEWTAASEALLARANTRVAMVIAPELTITPNALHTVRGEVSLRINTVGVAEFHPDAPLDLATPARLVPFVRRSPDPLLQLVPLTILDQVRAGSPSGCLVHQAKILAGHAPPPRPEVADRIASANHATIRDRHEEMASTLLAISEDRARSYAEVGITSSR
ncbi:hypothetical protein BH11MYX3_BH11MYX3_39100 [soil metagenome]